MPRGRTTQRMVMVAGSAGLMGEAIEYAVVALPGSGEASLECVVDVAGGLGVSIVGVAADPSVSFVGVVGRWGHAGTVGQRQLRDCSISGGGTARVATRCAVAPSWLCCRPTGRCAPAARATDRQIKVKAHRPVTPRVKPAHRDTERILPSRNPARVDPSMSHPSSTLADMSLWTSLRPTRGRSWAVTNECHTPPLRCLP